MKTYLLGALGVNESVVIVFFLVFVILAIFFLLSQQSLLQTIKPENRFMSPGSVWLQLIPLFNLIYAFIVVSSIARSIKKEYESYQNSETLRAQLVVPPPNRLPTYNIGLAYCIFTLASTIISFIQSFTPYTRPVSIYARDTPPFPYAGLVALVSLICWIIYWVSIHNYKLRLRQLAMQQS
jgi:hypothetical protein